MRRTRSSDRRAVRSCLAEMRSRLNAMRGSAFRVRVVKVPAHQPVHLEGLCERRIGLNATHYRQRADEVFAHVSFMRLRMVLLQCGLLGAELAFGDLFKIAWLKAEII